MSATLKGVLAMVAAGVIWGLAPIYYKLIVHVPPVEVLAHRILWSLAFFGAVLVFQRRLGEIARVLASARVLALVAVASVMITINWFVFILSIQIGRAIEASLGYYVFPLFAVVLGYGLLSERLSRMQWLAVALAAFAVALLAAGLGAAPWIALILASSFSIYGLIKKALPVGPLVSVTTEVVLLAPLALIWLWGVHFAGWTEFADRPGAVFGTNMRDTLLLIFSGPLTASPLILLSYATKRISFATLGLIQYINPTLQFTVAVVIFGEAFTGWHQIAFALIWTGLAIYSADALRQERAARRRVIRAGTS